MFPGEVDKNLWKKRVNQLARLTVHGIAKAYHYLPIFGKKGD